MSFELLTRKLELNSPLEEKALSYLEKHRILDLVVNITTSVLFSRPDKPREFLLNLLARIKIAKITSVDFPYLMEDSNLNSMFEVMDPTNQGFITNVQFREALHTLGLLSPNEELSVEEIITREKFKQEVNKRTHKIWEDF
ncbi:EF-hand calcium-binding domain-containing protein 10 isoform X1 [Monodelphis domestica]|uniref:EF-hand calcium-binding domain-containing protein 10-like n=1 Tax=Monodelphis domestica TaxID=13616 RepID=A0A5F8GBI3_MONDO|nr:EF-hand calcium-binding domain-containing protein 10 isoform X1 [Monodelphis domestica]